MVKEHYKGLLILKIVLIIVVFRLLQKNNYDIISEAVIMANDTTDKIKIAFYKLYWIVGVPGGISTLFGLINGKFTKYNKEQVVDTLSFSILKAIPHRILNTILFWLMLFWCLKLGFYGLELVLIKLVTYVLYKLKLLTLQQTYVDILREENNNVSNTTLLNLIPLLDIMSFTNLWTIDKRASNSSQTNTTTIEQNVDNSTFRNRGNVKVGNKTFRNN